MSYLEMRRKLKSLGLSSKGKKSELIARIEEAMKDTQTNDTHDTETQKTFNKKEMKHQNESSSTNISSIVLDPSVMFLSACLIAPLACEVLENDGALPSIDVFVNYVFHEVPLTALSILIMFLSFAHRKGARTLSDCERRVALWYLVNGIGFKSIMDTVSGSLQSWYVLKSVLYHQTTFSHSEL